MKSESDMRSSKVISIHDFPPNDDHEPRLWLVSLGAIKLTNGPEGDLPIDGFCRILAVLPND